MLVVTQRATRKGDPDSVAEEAETIICFYLCALAGRLADIALTPTPGLDRI